MDVREKLIEICFREFCDLAGDSPCGCDGCPYKKYSSENGECYEEYKKDKFVKIEKTITKNQVANNISFFDDCDYVIVKKYSETYQQIPAKTFIAHNSDASTENLILLNDYSSWTLN